MFWSFGIVWLLANTNGLPDQPVDMLSTTTSSRQSTLAHVTKSHL